MIRRPLVIMGAGRIARALLGQLLAREEYLRVRYNLTLPVAVLTNSRFLLAGQPYLAREDVARVAATGLHNGEPAPADYLDRRLAPVLDGSLDGRPIVLDLTAATTTTPALLAALDAACDVVLANKKPLCEEYAIFQRLTTHPHGRIGYEATAGAGLPIVQTLRTLHDAGDELLDATACLSGTLGYLCSELEDGRPLSEIVPEARERGFTEPDPREDLGGADVRRKALILARTIGQPLELADVPEAPLIPLDAGPVDEWLAGLPRHDAVLAARARAAHEQGHVLRYVARLQPGGCEVGLREVPRISAVGRLRGSDNILTARTRFYDERPLTISGPGAGPDVTAAGVFGDLLRLAGVS